MTERPAPSPDVRAVIVVHDEIVIECPAGVADEAKGWLVGCMLDGMGRYVTDVPVEVEVEISTTWAGGTDGEVEA